MAVPAAAVPASPAAPARRQRLGKKEKLQFRQQQSVPTVAAPAPTTAASPWSYYPLADSPTRTPPVLFDPSSTYCFVSSGSHVKIYSVASSTLLSTLSPPVVASTGLQARPKISCLLLNPYNPLQLITGSLDGMLRVWDYMEGRLLRTLEVGGAVLFACGHESLGDQLFVGLASGETKESKNDEELHAGIYCISLKPRAVPGTSLSPSTPRSPARRMRLAHPRPLTSLSLSPDGTYLISLNPRSINLCRTSHLTRGFARHIEVDEKLSCLAFHPTEDYFATGEEGGKIRIWYGVFSSEEEWEQSSKAVETTATKDNTTTIFHWHASTPSSLIFTPNGAYLVSAGLEAVMVLWQLHTGHQEYVPRLGSEVRTLSITEAPGVEQVVAARLGDGSVVFVGMGKLKVLRSIKGLKTDPVKLSNSTNRLIPLTHQPLTNSLVLPSSHPSSLQFYSPSSDSQVLELEISPSNRVSSAGEDIEPTRVERVSFSKPEKHGGYWMCTEDTWSKGRFAENRHLKFWRWDVTAASFTLVTRIERPHEAPLTSLAFSPTAPLLLTTSLDGQTKLWSPSSTNLSWSCVSSASYRSSLPTSSAWAPDGSMYVVGYAKSVTLCATGGGLIHSFPCGGLGEVRGVAFGGNEGEEVRAVGSKGTRGWDLLTFEESFSIPIALASITPKPSSALFVATEHAPHRSSRASTSTALIIDPSTDSIQAVLVPFGIVQSSWLSTSSSTNGKEKASSIAMVVLNSRGEVMLVGDSDVRIGGGEGGIAGRLEGSRGGQSRLFDEIFGSSSESPKAVKAAAAVVVPMAKGTGTNQVLDMPAHTLPPARLLWRAMFAPFSTAHATPLVEGIARQEQEEEGEDVEMEVEFAPVVYSSSAVGLAETFRISLSL